MDILEQCARLDNSHLSSPASWSHGADGYFKHIFVRPFSGHCLLPRGKLKSHRISNMISVFYAFIRRFGHLGCRYEIIRARILFLWLVFGAEGTFVAAGSQVPRWWPSGGIWRATGDLANATFGRPSFGAGRRERVNQAMIFRSSPTSTYLSPPNGALIL